MDKQDVVDYAKKNPKVVRKVAIAIVVLSLILGLGYCASRSEAGGYKHPEPAPTAFDVEVYSTNTSANSESNRTYVGGSTGLTSTAPCLGSTGVLFNAISTTYVEKGCVLRHYAASCQDDACRQRLMCLDPDLIPEAKAVLGCAP